MGHRKVNPVQSGGLQSDPPFALVAPAGFNSLITFCNSFSRSPALGFFMTA